MAYDLLAESVRLINGGPVAGADPLTRRRRFLPVAVDVDGDIAVTVFLRRAHGDAEWEEHVLARRGSQWTWVGGGGSGYEPLDLLKRPVEMESGHVLQFGGGSGGVKDGRRWIQYALLDVGPGVDHVLVDQRRALVPPQHGRMAIVWRDRRGVSVSAFDHQGRELETVQLAGEERESDTAELLWVLG